MTNDIEKNITYFFNSSFLNKLQRPAINEGPTIGTSNMKEEEESVYVLHTGGGLGLLLMKRQFLYLSVQKKV